MRTGGACALAAALAALALQLLALVALRLGDSSNHCLMTYMFEYPQFVRITVPNNELYPQYGLYSYSEGRLTEKARKMRFDGIPVLFLPGNSGSYQQVRSLASVALRKAFSYEYDYHFDYFTVNYNEELSGLYGGVLEQQTGFAALCLQTILGLYKINKHIQTIPESVIVIGHSMGGVIAKRLLTYPPTSNFTNIAVTLAAPIAAPVINTDTAMNSYYLAMNADWTSSSARGMTEYKVLISFGSGAKDVLVPACLSKSEFSDFSALVTAVPGVWTSTDHLSIVWCKQFVLVFNKFLFAIIDKKTYQVVDDKTRILAKARQYFKANRSLTLHPDQARATVAMVPDAFWYEDNRRIYQISRPDINKMTYLMIRLVGFAQDRFVAIESVNLEDKDWVFGCNALYTHGAHRICKNATSLSELTRWTGTAADFGRRKLALIHLHDLMMQEPEWTHVIVKIAPTKKPIMLNVDINDHASRHITVDLPSFFSIGRSVVKQETEKDAVYYELSLPGMSLLHHTYFLHVEPTASCKATKYHVSAEMHVPWAENNEYYHYFTHLKKKPMKLRLFNSDPNAVNDLEVTEHVKVIILLDPQCTFTISVSPTRYHMIAQLARHHSTILFPFIAAILLLATRSSLLSVKTTGRALSLHSALASEGVKPYYILVFGRLGTMALLTVPVLLYALETASLKNKELVYFMRSLLCIPAYMVALGVLNVAAAAVLMVMVFSSQLAHRLLLRIVWRGGGGTIAEKLATALQRAPVLVSVALVCSVPASCGAAALAAGAAFYFFMLSKMYEEYLEDYSYKLLAKIMSRVRNYFKSGNKNRNQETSEQALLKSDKDNILEKDEDASELALMNSDEVRSPDDEISDKRPVEATGTADECDTKENKIVCSNKPRGDYGDVQVENTESVTRSIVKSKEADDEVEEVEKCKREIEENNERVDEQLSNLNFHMIMFFLWVAVALVNVPALLTWARNFKYSMTLKPDTSLYPGVVMSVCAGFLWQVDGPRRNLKHYETLSQVLFGLAIVVLVLGPLATFYISYTVTAAFALITLQQLFDKELSTEDAERETPSLPENLETTGSNHDKNEAEPSGDNLNEANTNNEEEICETLKTMKEKIDFNDTDFI